jgi:predicted MFS family arabinose efflux permease
MNTKKLVDYTALLHFVFYGVVFIAELLSKNTIPANYIQFVIAAMGLGFVALTTDKSHLVNCLAFSAIVSSFLLFIASLIGAVISGEIFKVFTGYLVICWGVALVNTVRVKVFNSRANKQILSPAKSAGCDVNPLRDFPR